MFYGNASSFECANNIGLAQQSKCQCLLHKEVDVRGKERSGTSDSVTLLPMIGGQSKGNQLSRPEEPCHGTLLSEHGISQFVDKRSI